MRTRDPDRDLVDNLRRRSPRDRAELFEPLYLRHAETLHALCLRRTRNDADALDALQETLLAAVTQIDRFRGDALFSTWLHRVALNKCGEILRRRRRRAGLERSQENEGGNQPALEAAIDEEAGPLERVGEDEWKVRLLKAVEGLPLWLRRAVEMRYFEHLAYDEIAAAMAVPVGTVKSRLYRAHRSLAREIEPWIRSA